MSNSDFHNKDSKLVAAKNKQTIIDQRSKLKHSADAAQNYQAKLGEILVSEGLISPDQLRNALKEQTISKEYLGVTLMRNYDLSEINLIKSLSKVWNVKFYSLANFTPSQNIIDMIPSELAVKYQLFPLNIENDILQIAMLDPLNENALNIVEQSVGCSVSAGITLRQDLERLIDRYYNKLLNSNEFIRDFYDGATFLIDQEYFEAGKFLDLILALGYVIKADYCQLILRKDSLQIQMRINDFLHTIPIPIRRIGSTRTSSLRSELITRASGDPQLRINLFTGELSLQIDNINVYAAMTVYQLVDGDLYIMRFDQRLEPRQLNSLGVNKAQIKQIQDSLNSRSGAIIVSAPPKGGTTTTNYAILNSISFKYRSVLTLEDPIASLLPFAAQTKVNKEQHITTINTLKNLPKLDVDVLMLPQPANFEEAELLLRRAREGRIIITSYTGNNTFSIIAWLMQMGISAIDIASSIRLLIAQQPIPMICLDCRETHPNSDLWVKEFGFSGASKVFNGAGCSSCNFTGFKDRIMIFEVVDFNSEARDELSCADSLGSVKRIWNKIVRYSRAQDALSKCRQGLITPESVVDLCL